MKLLSSKNLQRGPLQDGEISQVMEAPSVPGDKGLYLPVKTDETTIQMVMDYMHDTLLMLHLS